MLNLVTHLLLLRCSSCSERIMLSDISHLVIDEADTLFDSSFEEAIVSIIKNVKVSP